MRGIALFATGLWLAIAPAIAQGPASPGSTAPEPSPAQSAQQQKMKTCNASASERGFKGDARQDFMKACLSGNQTRATMMKVCNAQAKQDKMSADARKSYISTCLKS